MMNMLTVFTVRACMQVVDVDLGRGVPHISNLQALASPTQTIWPQALFDLDFTGEPTCLVAFEQPMPPALQQKQ